MIAVLEHLVLLFGYAACIVSPSPMFDAFEVKKYGIFRCSTVVTEFDKEWKLQLHAYVCIRNSNDGLCGFVPHRMSKKNI